MKTTTTRAPFTTTTDKFLFVAQEHSIITPDMQELTQCSIPLTASRVARLQELNPGLAQWVSDCETSYEPIREIVASRRSILGGDERPPPPKLVFDLYVVYGMRILICRKQDMKFSRNYFLRFLEQLYRDQVLFASLVGSNWILLSPRLSIELNNSEIYFSLRDAGEQGKFITVDMSLMTSIEFPSLKVWQECGLKWLFRSHFCCEYHVRSRTPWTGDKCR